MQAIRLMVCLVLIVFDVMLFVTIYTSNLNLLWH
jgi:hypothetical protein